MSTSTIDTETLENSVQTGVNQLLRGGWGEALKTILFALLLLVICLVIKAILLKLLDRGLNRFSQVEKSLHTFIRSMANILLWFITLMVVADSLGINASSLLALVSILGLAVSLSVKDSLSNLAGGLTILGTKPFKVGDYVEIGETGGTVQEIGLVYTKLTTIDNRRILMPNSLVVDAQVTNYTTEPLRRVDLTVSASYDAPVEKVKQTIQGVLKDHDKILLDYWTVYHDLLEEIKTAFDREHISIPYPHLEVKLHQS